MLRANVWSLSGLASFSPTEFTNKANWLPWPPPRNRQLLPTRPAPATPVGMSGQRRSHCPPCACPCTTAWHSQPCPRESEQAPPARALQRPPPHSTHNRRPGGQHDPAAHCLPTSTLAALRPTRLPPAGPLASWLAVPSAWGPVPWGLPHLSKPVSGRTSSTEATLTFPWQTHASTCPPASTPFPSFSFHNIFTYATCIALTPLVHFFILLFCLSLLKHIEEDKQTICVSSGQ